MVDAVNPVASTATHDVAARAAAIQANKADQTAADTAVEAKAQVAAPAISPRFRPDPLSGTLVTEFTNDKGQVTAQYPSTAALNYLRVGLDADGTRKATDKSHDAPAATTIVA